MCEGGGWANDVSREVRTEGLRHEVLPEGPGVSFPALGGLGNAIFHFPASSILEDPGRVLEGWSEPLLYYLLLLSQFMLGFLLLETYVSSSEC